MYSGPFRVMPALLIRMSIGPRFFSTSDTIWTASSRTSCTRTRVRTSEEICCISRTSDSSSEAVRERHAMEAPAAAQARAVALPIPRPAPVMRITFPLSLPVNLEGEMNGYVSL